VYNRSHQRESGDTTGVCARNERAREKEGEKEVMYGNQTWTAAAERGGGYVRPTGRQDATGPAKLRRLSMEEGKGWVWDNGITKSQGVVRHQEPRPTLLATRPSRATDRVHPLDNL